MKSVVTLVLVLAFTAAPVFAQDQPIRASMEHAAAAVAEQTARGASPHHAMFWSGLALGVAGATTAVLGLTTSRVEDSSTGNAPKGAYQACVAQQTDPIYASNQCNALKGKNLGMLWGGVAIGAAGTVLMIRSTHTSAELDAGAIRIVHRIRF